ncbi:MAG: PIN domain-containing protein [Cyanobacteria bacterium RI_101]|jgi:PIN domain nuclease of toxin-antitoxin system|nr:PIN domain-containing protein [Cyanobacteria bacterium RI_101]
MNILLDTHIFLWFISNSNQLSDYYYDIISDQENKVYLSVVSIWEAIIKYQIGKLSFPESPEIYLPKQRKRHSIKSLSINELTITRLTELPPLHRDPFDRLLICQALHHNFQMITEDHKILSYPIISFV